jgi:hypothetical protein
MTNEATALLARLSRTQKPSNSHLLFKILPIAPVPKVPALDKLHTHWHKRIITTTLDYSSTHQTVLNIVQFFEKLMSAINRKIAIANQHRKTKEFLWKR